MSGGPFLVALVLYLALITIERVGELFLSRHNARILRAIGAEEFGRSHMPWFVALHVACPLALVAEVVWLGARPGPLWALWLGVFVAAQILRFAVIRALGVFWNVRVLVVPGMRPIRRGPYRWLRHPNYLAVALELLSGALLFGAWRTGFAATVIHVALVRLRVPVEERALERAAYRENWSPTP
jgi:methyltransferase